MNTKCSFLVSFFAPFLSYFGISQEIIEKNYFDSNKDLGAEVILKNSTIKVIGTKVYKIFELESAENGEYYLNAWMIGTELNDFGSGKFLEYDLTVNNKDEQEKFKPAKHNWHNVSYKIDNSKEKKQIQLNKGLNQIAFSCEAPIIPQVDFIKLSKTEEKSEISENKYNIFIDEIKTQVQDRIKNPKAQNDTSIILKRSVVLPNPAGNYYHHVGISFRYTFYYAFYFNPGQQVFFTTHASDGYAHVIEVFSSSRPETYTWVALSNSSGMASLNITIPNSDAYFVRVRAYHQETQGLVDLNVNGQYYYSDCAVSGSGFRHAHETPTTYNYYTCKVTGDSHIWIEDDSGTPGKIRAFNDDYYGGGGDYYWNLASRVKKDFSVRIGAVLVSAYGSNNPTGTCDLYIMCQNSTIGPSTTFPILKADDAIQSAPTSSNYNCASWGGGRINLGRYFWASNPENSNNLSGDWYVSGNFWQSWDNFYGNNPLRFTGAPDYTRSGASSSNGEVAMWYNPNYYSQGIGDYTHFSVTKPANDQPHGYDWESKPGGNMRTFHPRDALNNNNPGGYGQISLYYRRVNPLLKSYSLEESINLGLTVLQKVELSDEEKTKIDIQKANASENEIEIFNNKLQKLVEKINSPEMINQSNPGFLFKSIEFTEMLAYCENKGEKIWPMLFEHVFSEENDDKRDLSVLLLNEITREYGYLMEQVKKEWNNNNYTPEGAYIAPSPIDNTKNYIKKLLALKSSESSITLAKGIEIDNRDLLSVYPNPFKYQTTVIYNITENESNVALKVFDINGKLLETVFSNCQFNAGNHEIKWTANNYEPGVYFFSLIINGKSMNRRFLIE